METESIVTRLRDASLGFLSVSGSLSLADALDDAKARFPCAYVVTPTDRAEPNRTQGRHRQRVTSRVAIVIGVKADAASLSGAKDRLGQFKRSVIDNLTGWRPDTADTALDYASSDLRAIAGGIVWYEVAFQCAWTLTVAEPDAPASAAV